MGLLNYGLDLRGGVHVVLQAKPATGQAISDEDMSHLQAVMRQRVDQLGVSEPVLQREGKDRLIVELAGVKDPDQAVELIGKTAMLEFRTIDGKVVLTGRDLVDAKPSRDTVKNEPIVNLEFNTEGARKFGQITSQLVQQYPEVNGQRDPRRNIAIYLDNELLTAPYVKDSITDGRAQIEGGFATFDEAAGIAALLRGGALPVNVEIMEKRTVGPSLGQDSLQKSAVAVMVGLIAIGLFMILYYRLLGVIADLSLVVYALILLAALAGLHATLTLPGIAGLVLSVGMAVDANIIIYERIRDELRHGKSFRAAVESGFRRAFWTIFDSNLTTLIAGAVLYYLGTGPIRGFAVTLSLGIVVSMFTAIVLTRWLVRLVVGVDVLRSAALLGVSLPAASPAGPTGAQGSEKPRPSAVHGRPRKA
ncbi:MAG: protein translocase subunit SecD [Clostridia bacterium]|nr:MAG: protein translocase subunit SecD [Clostridia bacterium]